jgi:hypothetical protein
MSKESKGLRELRSESRGNESGTESRAEFAPESQVEAGADAHEDVFEGSAHVLRGLEQQLTYWEVLDGHEAAKKEMVGVLRVTSRAVREALKRARAADHEDH